MNKIYIEKMLLDKDHWSSTWIPISYDNVLNNQQYKNSFTFLWGNNNTQEVYGICRSYYVNNINNINKNNIKNINKNNIKNIKNINKNNIKNIKNINNNIIEIGDVWLNDKFRGKSYNGIKYSVLFMKQVISKIWQTYPTIKKIGLIVSKKNIPAIKLYKKLNFIENSDNILSKKIKLQLKIKDGLYMIRNKRIIKSNLKPK